MRSHLINHTHYRRDVNRQLTAWRCACMIDDATQKQLERGCFQVPKPPAKKSATFSNKNHSGSCIMVLFPALWAWRRPYSITVACCKPISSLAAARVKEALFSPSQVEILFDNACASRFCCLHDENNRFCFIVFESFHIENRLRFDIASLKNATRFRRCRVNKRRIRKEKFAFLSVFS